MQKFPPNEERSHSPSGVSKPEARGLALQKPRVGGTRFSENVKSYLTARFDVGQTGRKADPSQVAADMRTTRSADGSRRFSIDEWLTKGQIQSLLSRLSATSKRKGVSRVENVDSDTEEDLLLQQEIAFLSDVIRDKEVEDIFSKVGVVHPIMTGSIMYDGYDLCEYTNIERHSKFNVKTLKAICEHFELSFKLKDTKTLLIQKIANMVKECSCCRPGRNE